MRSLRREAEKVLLENIGDPRGVFVFPTQVARDRWADWVLLRLAGGEGKTAAVDMTRFLAWDWFKGEAIRSVQQGADPVSAPLRKLFVEEVLAKNAASSAAGEMPVFRSLIRPEFSSNYPSFVKWFSSILPSLRFYLEVTASKSASKEAVGGAEREDLRRLEKEYSAFLERNGLFESAWEKPPLDVGGKRVFLFFPELLEDYAEYALLLSSSPEVTLAASMPEDPSVPAEGTQGSGEESTATVVKAKTGREEVRFAAQYLRGLVEEGKASWEDIALSVAGREEAEAYVLRELSLYGIPVANRMGKPLGSSGAGAFFAQTAACVSSAFAFRDLSALLLNPALPWKDFRAIDQLMAFGEENFCICSWTEGARTVDTWQEAFSSLRGKGEERSRTFYEALKEGAEKLTRAPTFASLREGYFAFRDRFFDAAGFTAESDALMGRALSELSNLVTLEEDFPAVHCSAPFRFFVETLKTTVYVAKQSGGVNLFPYKTAAAAPFPYHLVLGATQKGISVVYRRLPFLPRSERERLNLKDEDVSETFVRCYDETALREALFFLAEEDFEGFAVPHSALRGLREHSALSGGRGPFLEEQFYLRDGETCPFPARIMEEQKNCFEQWSAFAKPALSAPPVSFARLIPTESAGPPQISATMLKKYAECPRKWYNAARLRLDDYEGEDDALSATGEGRVYHGVLEKYFRHYKDSGLTLGREADTAVLDQAVTLVLRGLEADRELSALGAHLVRAEKEAVTLKILACLRSFLRYFSGYRVLETEKKYTREAADASYVLTGRVDLVLAGSEGEAVIVDFKSSGMPPAKDCDGSGKEGLRNFQLPLYTMLTSSGAETALFFSVGKAAPQVLFGDLTDRETGKRKGRRTPIYAGDETYTRILAETVRRSEEFAAAVGSGEAVREAAALTRKPKGRTCALCAFRPVCRTTYH